VIPAEERCMTDTLDAPLPEQGRDWRLRISLFVTLGWLMLGFIYVSSVVGWTEFVSQRAPELGGFLEGAFAPLAFLWLVVGFFLQQQQLHHNTGAIRQQLVEMRRTAEQAEVQSRAIAADELHSRQDTFLRIADMVNEQLAVIAGFIVTSWLIETPEGMEGEGARLWEAQGQGDQASFNRKMFSMVYSGDCPPERLFWGTTVRSAHTSNFIDNFERLLRLASRCDPEGVIADAIRDGNHGRVYQMMHQSRPAEAMQEDV
jgi:hypothetical protein